jgi:hypothetical protein
MGTEVIPAHHLALDGLEPLSVNSGEVSWSVLLSLPFVALMS